MWDGYSHKKTITCNIIIINIIIIIINIIKVFRFQRKTLRVKIDIWNFHGW